MREAIYCSTEKRFKQIQDYLFRKGYTWRSGQKSYLSMTVPEEGIYICIDGERSWSQDKTFGYGREHEINDGYSEYKIVKAERLIKTSKLNNFY